MMFCLCRCLSIVCLTIFYVLVSDLFLGVWLGWGWGLDAPAHSSATILWPRITCYLLTWPIFNIFLKIPKRNFQKAAFLDFLSFTWYPICIKNNDTVIEIQTKSNILQLNPTPTDLKGLTNFICYRRNSVIANIRNNRKQAEGTVNTHSLSEFHFKRVR